MKIVNPATEEIIEDVPVDSKESLQHSFQLLQQGQTSWATVNMEERINCLRLFSNLLEKNKTSLATTLSAETGKPLQQAANEIAGARTRIKWLCDHAKQYLQEEIMSQDEKMLEKITYEPLGVICNISAWNYPYLVGVNVYVPALIAGNAVMYKPSEYATLTGIEIDKLLKQAGIPENVFQVAIGAGDIGAALLEMPFDGYFFTGSYATGKYIYEKVAQKMVPCQLELGGKDPLYVTDDIVDINAVAAGTADGAFYNNGQSCCAVERIYVHENAYDDYVEAFVAEVESYKIGLPSDEGVYIGALTRKAQIDILERHVNDALAKGAKVLLGGKKRPGKGNYFEPTVLVNVDHSMLVMQEESFGPIIGIMKVKDDEEAIQRMLDTSYGLTAAVYSSNTQRAEKIMQRMNSGTVYLNCCDRVSAALPWSGRKNSGFGSTLSSQGIRAFVQPKAWHLRS